MNISTLLAELQTYLDNEFPTIAIAVAGGESRPIPTIEIEDVSVQELSNAKSMNGYSSSVYEDRREVERHNAIPYEARVSFLIRHRGSVEAAQLTDRLKSVLYKLSNRPERMSDSLSRVEVGSTSGMNHQFINPVETSFTQSAMFTSTLVHTDSTYQNIESFDIEVENTDNY